MKKYKKMDLNTIKETISSCSELKKSNEKNKQKIVQTINDMFSQDDTMTDVLFECCQQLVNQLEARENISHAKITPPPKSLERINAPQKEMADA